MFTAPLAVIALPVLMPIAALLQLLFPGLLQAQWRQYKIAVYTLLSQSTLIFLHFAAVTWIFTSPRPAWLSDNALAGALVAVALFGGFRAMFRKPELESPPPGPAPAAATRTAANVPATSSAPVAAPAVAPLRGRPHRVEYLALGGLALAGFAWWLYQFLAGGSPWDQMSVVTIAAVIGLSHVVLRRALSSAASTALVTTELVFLWSLVFAGAGLGYYQSREQANQLAAGVTSDWPAFRGGRERTGAADPQDAGPAKPVVLWTFDPAERKGRVYIHSTPTVVDDQVYVGALHEVLATVQGYVYCINAKTGEGEKPRPIGDRLWRFTAQGSLKPVYSSPTVAGGKIYFGEGYHQDHGCRLFCLDARGGEGERQGLLWAKTTASHVESSPLVEGSRIYFGAGDDGLYAVDGSQLEGATEDRLGTPKTLWQVKELHIDGSPILVGKRLFVGSVIGDLYQKTQALCIDADSGEVLWRTPTPMPVGDPSYAAGQVFFGMSNGKVNEDSDRPAGAVWCLDEKTGERKWAFETANSVLGSPALAGDLVFFTSRDHHCYAVQQKDGKQKWKVKLTGPAVASPIVAAGKVYALTTGGVLYRLAADSGEVDWQFPVADAEDDAYSSPTLAGGRIYVAVAGKVYCVGDAAK